MQTRSCSQWLLALVEESEEPAHSVTDSEPCEVEPADYDEHTETCSGNSHGGSSGQGKDAPTDKEEPQPSTRFSKSRGTRGPYSLRKTTILPKRFCSQECTRQA